MRNLRQRIVSVASFEGKTPDGAFPCLAPVSGPRIEPPSELAPAILRRLDHSTEPSPAIRPNLTLWLLAFAHAVNHAQAVIMPMIFLAIIKEFGVGVAAVGFVAAASSISSGLVQASFAYLTRRLSRRSLMTAGGLLFGAGFAAQSAAPTFPMFAITNVISRVGGAPQHPVGNGLLA